jgi:transposase
MNAKRATRRVFDSEFKRQTVRLVTEDKKSCRAVERDLGLSMGTVYKWVQQAKDDPEGAFPGKGNVRPSDAEIRRLVKENGVLRRERDILKKVVAIFSRPPLTSTGS